MKLKKIIGLVVTGLLHLVLVNPTTLFAQSGPTPAQITNYSGLHKAAHVDDLDQIRSLLESGAAIEERDSSGRTPVIIAAFASNEAAVELLAKSGADLDALENRFYDIVTIASVANDIEMLDTALEHGASAGNITSPYEGTALIAAAHLGHHEVVDRLIKAGAPLDHINNLHWTALIEAVVLGDGGANHIQTLKLLVDAGADQTIGDSSGDTASQLAIARGFSEMVDYLD